MAELIRWIRKLKHRAKIGHTLLIGEEKLKQIEQNIYMQEKYLNA